MMEPPQEEDIVPPPANMENALRQIENVRQDHQEDIAIENENVTRNNNTNEEPRVKSTTCKPVAVDRPKIELPSQQINNQIQFMKDHALIGKFIAFGQRRKHCIARSRPNGS